MSRVTLTGKFTRIDGTPATGTVRVTPSRSPIMDSAGRVVISGPQSFPVQSGGLLEVEIPASNDPDLGAPFTYRIEVILDHASWKISKVWIPHGSATVDLSQVSDFEPVPGVATRVVTIPADGTDGQVLVWDGAGFSWMDAPAGPQGPPGEVTTAALTTALAGKVTGTGMTVRVDTTVGTRVLLDHTGGTLMLYGDTGWRDIRGLLENGWKAEFLRVRRVGNTVNILGKLNGSAKTGDKIVQSPPGFAFYAGSHQLPGRLGGDRMTLLAGGAIQSISTSISAAMFETWITNDPWPITLPGVPI